MSREEATCARYATFLPSVRDARTQRSQRPGTLRAYAVDLLLVTPRFIDGHEREAEDLVRAAIDSGAEVEVPSGETADRLDRAASGIAARLRFAIDEPPAPRTDAPR